MEHQIYLFLIIILSVYCSLLINKYVLVENFGTSWFNQTKLKIETLDKKIDKYKEKITVLTV